jgi:superfamily II DNA or RNA helicase
MGRAFVGRIDSISPVPAATPSPRRRSDADPDGTEDECLLDQLLSSGALFGSDGFRAEDLAAGLRYADAGHVRIVTSNMRDDFIGLFGVVDELDSTGRCDVSVAMQKNRSGQWVVEGRTPADGRKNGERVAALLHAARKQHGHSSLASASLSSPAALRLEIADVRCGTKFWNVRNDADAALLSQLRMATIEGYDPALERRCADAGLRPLTGIYPREEIDARYHHSLVFPVGDLDEQDQRWTDFLANERQHFESAGHSLHPSADFGLEFVAPEQWISEIAVPDNVAGGSNTDDADDEIDWFEFRYGISVDGRQVSLLPALVEYLRSRPQSFRIADLINLPAEKNIPLLISSETESGDDLFVSIPAAKLYGALSALGELLDPNPASGGFSKNTLRQVGALTTEGHLHLHRADAARIVESSLPASNGERGPEFEFRCHADMRKLGKHSDRQTDADVDVPEGLQATLRPYQRDGVAWLQLLREQRLSGILADDMGLGKTLQTLCHLLIEKVAGRLDRPCLIVAPKSVVPNWEAETKKFAPSLSVLVLQGSRRHRYYDVLEHCDLVITSFPTLMRDAERLAEQPFHYVVLDEAQTIKNSRNRISQAAYQLDARFRLCLSGTPIENHLGELWSQFHFLMPGFLGSEDSFSLAYRQPIEKDRDEGRRQLLAERVKPVMLRRTKSKVATDLPAKTEIIRSVELTPRQVELYEAVRASLHHDLHEEIAERGFDASRMLILDGLLKLRQICCHPRLLRMESTRSVSSSAKLDLLDECLPDLVKCGSRILIFSQFTRMLDLIAEALDRLNIDHLMLTGKSRDRGQLCEDFQSGKAPVFLISLRAGGTGLNLTAADTVFHFDPWWNPALEAQATDRAYRIGQKRPVFVHKLIAAGTIEEKIQLLQQKKRALFDGILDGIPQSLDFSESELDDLLAPITPSGSTK